MKKLFLTLALTLLLVPTLFAQDLETTTNLYNAGAVALNEGNKAEAIKNFEEAYEQAAMLGAEGMDIMENCKGIIPSIYMAIGKEFGEKRDITNAVKNLETGLARAEEFGNTSVAQQIKAVFPPLFMQEGSTKLNEKDFTGAIENYKKVLEYNPSFAMAYLRMGMAASRIGDDALTISSYEKAIELGQKATASKQLATYYLKKSLPALKAKKFDTAIEFAQKSASVLETPQAFNICGKAAFSKKDYALAISSFEKYIALSPNAKDKNQAFYQLGTAYESTGNKAKACSYYKQIMNDPSFKEFATHKVTQQLKCQ